jgi:2-dehydropantoate 2-reductase
MRYVIIGAGSVGGAIAARLAQHSPHPPLLIARGSNGAAIAAEGLRLRTPDSDERVPVEVASGPDEVELRVDDVLVVATKSHQVEAALLQWVDRPVLSDDGETVGTVGELLPVLLALNGLASEDIALRYFRRVYGVCVWIPAVHLEDGEVVVRMAPTTGVFIFGRHPALATEPADRELLSAIAEDWNASSLGAHVVDDVRRWKYTKLLSNLSNGVQALVGTGDSEAAAIDVRLRDEAVELYRAAGIDWASDEEESVWRGDLFRIRPVPGVEATGGSSWQSMARGTGSIETDYLNGEIVALARSLGRTAPLNETIQTLARRAALEKRAPGSITAAELSAALDLALAPVVG